jgi:hypothetical protein
MLTRRSLFAGPVNPSYNPVMLRDANGNPAMLLLKLGQREHMEQFRKGLLYMNTRKYFRDLESDPARADRYEGVSYIFQPEDATITLSTLGFGEIVIESKDLAAPTTISMKSELCCNLFCLYSITAPSKGTLFPSEHIWFGDSMVLVLDTQEFLNRIVVAAKAQNLTGKGKQVEYFNPETHTGKLDRFKKPNRFAHQREYRIAFESPGTDPLVLDIGDITDITSEMLQFCDADNTLKFSEDDAREAGLAW